MSVHNAGVEISRQERRGRRLLLDEATALGRPPAAWLTAQPGCTDGYDGRHPAAAARVVRRDRAARRDRLAGRAPRGVRRLRRRRTVVDRSTRGRRCYRDGARVTLHAAVPDRYVAACSGSPVACAQLRVGGGRATRRAHEAELYEGLGLRTCRPSCAGRGAPSRRVRLVTVDDIRGDLHSHTTASDGEDSIEEMARAAMARGYGYLAITEHSPA